MVIHSNYSKAEMKTPPLVTSRDYKEIIYFFYGSHPDVFSLGTNNNKGFRQTHLLYYFIIIRVATCFDPIGSNVATTFFYMRR